MNKKKYDHIFKKKKIKSLLLRPYDWFLEIIVKIFVINIDIMNISPFTSMPVNKKITLHVLKLRRSSISKSSPISLKTAEAQ